MANQIIGKIHVIEPTQTIVSKKDTTKSIQKRTIVLCVTRFDSVTGEKIGFENFPAFEFIGDKCALLDQFTPGQVVAISFDLQGSRITGDNGQDRWFTSVRGYKIELYQRQPQQVQQVQQTQQEQQPTPLVSMPQPMAQPSVQPKQDDGLPF